MFSSIRHEFFFCSYSACKTSSTEIILMYLIWFHRYRAYEKWLGPTCDCVSNHRQPAPPTRHGFQLGEDLQHALTICVPGTFKDVSLARLSILFCATAQLTTHRRIYLILLPVSTQIFTFRTTKNWTFLEVPNLHLLSLDYYTSNDFRFLFVARFSWNRARNVGFLSIVSQDQAVDLRLIQWKSVQLWL